MSRTTAAAVRKMKDGQSNYIWQPSVQAGQPATLLGYALNEDENMPAIASNSLSIAFGNFKRGYIIVDRMGTRMLRDPFTNKPYVGFYTTKRVGGMVADSNAIKLLKFAN
ncbi:MAG: Phage capsid family protein [bacterium ADurb.Bin374]|nr:MAG: Phage capsid family protein [bacterium ADurb.Bin374]